MTLQESKDKANQIYGSWFSVMRDWISDPPSGYKSLEDALTRTVIYVSKEVEKVYQQYEKDNPL